MKRMYAQVLSMIGALMVLTGCAGAGGAAPASADRTVHEKSLERDEISRDNVTDPLADDSSLEEPVTRTVDVDAKRGQQSGLRAGSVDDNKQFNRFNAFLEEKKTQVAAYPLPVQERIMLKVTDAAGASLANARISVSTGGKKLCGGRTYADGTFLFFPREYPDAYSSYRVDVAAGGKTKTVSLDRQGQREVLVALDLRRENRQQVPLDIVFILDTTASMAEEINRLKTTIEIIYSNLVYFPSQPIVRFGLVLFRDRGDDYVVHMLPLTGDLSRFQAFLNKVEAAGGGDWPEDLQEALVQSIRSIEWNPDGIRMAFIITDAQPHLDYGQQYTYVSAVHDAREKGVKIFSIGTGELPLSGEYVLRQIAQYTYAKYLFLTYGERSDSEGGRLGSVSHHVGENYQTDKLEALIIQLAREELSHLTSRPLEPEEEYFQATRVDTERKTETLKKLFDMAISQLADYSSLKMKPGTRASIIPFVPGAGDLVATGEYFTEQAVLSLAADKAFTLVERENLQKVLAELEFQLSDLADESKAARLGKLLGAEVLVMGKLYRVQANYEIFLKLVRVETAEILSVIKVKIDGGLGL